jgi:hypothetical protein
MGCGEAPSVGFADTSPMKGEEAGYSSPFMGEPEGPEGV